MSKNVPILPADYPAWLTSLKQRIQGARQRALLAANHEQIRLYHDIGRDILVRQTQQGWGAKVIDRLSADLRAAFPGMKGLSSRNLKYMKFFAQERPDFMIGQQTAAQLPWFHIIAIITKLPDPDLRDWYPKYKSRALPFATFGCPFDVIPCHPAGGFLAFIEATLAAGHTLRAVRTVTTRQP